MLPVMFTGKKLEISPVRDAYREECECPLCLLMDKAEKGYIGSFLGGAVMVPEARVEMNRAGFCPDHTRKLFGGDNKLGLALMTATHIREHASEMASRRNELLERAGEAAGGKTGLTALARKKSGLSEGVRQYREYIERFVRSCLLCERLGVTLERYLFTIVYLWQKDEEFAAAFRSSHGFCLPHLSSVLESASAMLGEKELARFLSELLPIQERSFDRLTEELDRYAEHFDYRNTGMAWGSERDAVPRALQKLSGGAFGSGS